MSRGWACLMYHDVTPALPPRNGGAERFAVPVEAFERQLDLIREEGLRGCSIAEAVSRPEGRVAISFDDGDAGQYERAFPALVARDMTATFFITTAWVGSAGYVTWTQLAEMRSAGMSIQSHTRTHPFLSALSAEELLVELRDSRLELNEALGQDTVALALPGGDEPRPALRHLLPAAGYRVVATSRWGVNPPAAARSGENPMRIQRCTIMGDPAPDRFRRIVRGDPWVLGLQRARGSALRAVRTGMGPGRYASLRRRVLDTLGAIR